MATLFGMALGGWMSGAIFDLTGSYRAAFVNGIALEPAQPVDRDLAAAPSGRAGRARLIPAAPPTPDGPALHPRGKAIR